MRIRTENDSKLVLAESRYATEIRPIFEAESSDELHNSLIRCHPIDFEEPVRYNHNFDIAAIIINIELYFPGRSK